MVSSFTCTLVRSLGIHTLLVIYTWWWWSQTFVDVLGTVSTIVSLVTHTTCESITIICPYSTITFIGTIFSPGICVITCWNNNDNLYLHYTHLVCTWPYATSESRIQNQNINLFKLLFRPQSAIFNFEGLLNCFINLNGVFWHFKKKV